jgi:Spy/CpxP family protein refolding chaperone
MAWQMNRYWVVVVGMALAIAVGQVAWAQRGRGRGFGRLFGGIAKAQLATLDEVQTELKLSDEQKTQVADINDALGEDRSALFGGDFGAFSEIRPEMDRLNREASGEVDKVLDDNQRKRLQEIAIQVNGPAALNDPSVVEQLKLTDEQKQKLEDVRAENNKAAEEAMADFGEMSREERREKFRDLSETAGEKLLGVLTDEQKEQFEQMKGAEIDVDLSPLFRRGRPGN